MLYFLLIYFVSVIDKQAADGEDALLGLRQKIHALNEDTAQALKKNVYKNYSQFIETAREISSKGLTFIYIYRVFFGKGLG